MTWEQYAAGYDDDTVRLLEIAVDFLTLFFGYDEKRADEVMASFLQSYSGEFDEDALHHELSYKVAAIAHYLIGLRGPRNDLGDWLLETEHVTTPQEALTYFREHYFKR